MPNPFTPAMPRLVRGGLIGLLATIPMTLAMLAARRSRLLRTPPPQEITKRLLAPIASPRARAGPQLRAAAWIAHFGYGALGGVGYALLRRRLPQAPRWAGLLYGALLWSVSYLGLMPALGLYPWPDEDATPRLGVMIAAHGVYGLALATIDHHVVGQDARSSERASCANGR